MLRRAIQTFRERHALAWQLCLGLFLAGAFNAIPTASAPAPPVVYPLRWYQPGTDSTDTPAPLLYTRAQSRIAGGGVEVSAIAYPASGSEAAPGVFLNITAAGEASNTLRFDFIDAAAPPSFQALGSVNGVNPPVRGDGKFQTARLVRAPLADIPVHRIKVRVTNTGGVTGETAELTLLDPREELKRELSELPTLAGGAGYASIDAFQAEMAPIIERAQADFRIHGWGDAAERAYERTPAGSPVSWTLDPDSGDLPLLLDGRGGLRGGDGQLVAPAPDVSGTLLRLEPWVTVGFLTPAQEASGEYFAALLNVESNRIGRSSYAELATAPQAGPQLLPEIYRRSPGGPGCFPRQNVDEFQLPDQLFFTSMLDSVKVAPFSSLPSLLNPFLPGANSAAFQDLADTARLFNDQTANLWSPASGDGPATAYGARHRPHVPRVRVYASIRDGVTQPCITWTFSDAGCSHVQDYALVVVDGAPPRRVEDGVFQLKLPAGTVPSSVTVTVFDNEGYSASRTVKL